MKTRQAELVRAQGQLILPLPTNIKLPRKTWLCERSRLLWPTARDKEKRIVTLAPGLLRRIAVAKLIKLFYS
jgi:hypothetical protein